MPKKNKLDPVFALHDVGWLLLRGHKGEEAIDRLFQISLAPELPPEWRRKLKTLTRQVRRIVSYDRKAREAVAEGNRTEAWRQIDLAEKVLGSAPLGLTVTFTGPAISGTEDLSHTVLKGAEAMVYDTRRFARLRLH